MIRRHFAGVVAAVALIAAAGCRTTAPAGAAIVPLTATTADAARTELQARRDAFAGARSLMRVRWTGERGSQSFRAQLVVPDARRMSLTVYSPIGTTVARVEAEGETIVVERDGSRVRTNVESLASQFGIFGGELLPAEMAMLLLGLPPRDDIEYDVAPGGLRTATAGDLAATFDPPAFPARNVTIVRGGDTIEIEHLEVAALN